MLRQFGYIDRRLFLGATDSKIPFKEQWKEYILYNVGDVIVFYKVLLLKPVNACSQHRLRKMHGAACAVMRTAPYAASTYNIIFYDSIQKRIATTE